MSQKKDEGILFSVEIWVVGFYTDRLLIGLKSLLEFFCGGWEDGVGLWLILLNMGIYTLWEIMHSGNRKIKK